MTDKTQAQLIELQTRISFLEDTVDQLSDVIATQDRQLMDLQDQLRIIYQQVTSKDEAQIAPFDLLADRPPHY
ncbi:SlyX family protein [Moraxella nasicaprae]|uniref:SlyX family protein n=1 Tax=Moraxella nasicaprae TaxID=2904122 RepID=A0ABY6F3V9_9GAMM|nr:SlyX family protein [Moraxella nasicaprae]UXZ04771.1 SlyX family protein [Moraxella nasicaprae]